MAAEKRRGLGLPFGLVGAAALLLAHAWCEASSLTLGHGIAAGALWCAVGGLLLRGLGRRCRSPLWLVLGGVGLFFAHLLIDAIQRRFWGLGSGMEYLLLGGLVNLGFFFLGRDEPRLRRLTLPLSLGVAVFALSLSQGWLGVALGALYLALTVLSLVRLPGGQAPLARPATALFLLAPILGAFALGSWLVSGRGATPPGGLLMGSGGGEKSDPYGRGGVGNGEGEVAATQKTEDIGFANTDIVVESERRTLFDAVSEIYGEPETEIKKKGPTHRKINFLAKDIIEKPKGPQVAPRASKGFSTRRTQGRPAAQTKNEAANALLYVTGRAPLYLRLTAYDSYEKTRWREGRVSGEVQIVTPRGENWMGSPLLALAPIVGAHEEHRLKIGLLASDRLPSPPHVDEVRIDRVNAPDLYRWAQAGIFRLDNVPQVPAGVTVEFRSRTLDYARLKDREIQPTFPVHSIAYQGLPSDLDPRVSEMAREWTKDVPPGWRQVERVVAKLRTHARLDRNARAPQGADPVSWFLFEGKRGPDYLFATSAALMLRSLGYGTRLVNGLYVSGKKRDIRTGHQLVHSEDLHFWVEVQGPFAPNEERPWVMWDPTPGYETPSPLPTLAERIRFALEGARLSLRKNLIALALSAFLATLAWIFRSALKDAWGTVRWHGLARLAPERATVDALRLIERRAAWAGVPRPRGRPLRERYRAHADAAPPDEARALSALLDAAERALYSSCGPHPQRPAERTRRRPPLDPKTTERDRTPPYDPDDRTAPRPPQRHASRKARGGRARARLPARRRPCPARRHARPRKDDSRQGAGARRRERVRPHPVHARPPARRHHRLLRL